MSKRIVVDPITRIEGHLRIDVEVDGTTYYQMHMDAFETAYPQLMSGGVCDLAGRFEDDAIAK